MSILGDALTAVMRLMQTEFTLFDLTFSFWQIFLWTLIVGVVAWLIGRWMDS